MPGQARRPEPSKFLDVSLLRLESALLSRAAELEKSSDSPGLNRVIANELRKLAEELHHW